MKRLREAFEAVEAFKDEPVVPHLPGLQPKSTAGVLPHHYLPFLWWQGSPKASVPNIKMPPVLGILGIFLLRVAFIESTRPHSGLP